LNTTCTQNKAPKQAKKYPIQYFKFLYVEILAVAGNFFTFNYQKFGLPSCTNTRFVSGLNSWVGYSSYRRKHRVCGELRNFRECSASIFLNTNHMHYH